MVKTDLDLGSLRFYESYKGHYFIDILSQNCQMMRLH